MRTQRCNWVSCEVLNINCDSNEGQLYTDINCKYAKVNSEYGKVNCRRYCGVLRGLGSPPFPPPVTKIMDKLFAAGQNTLRAFQNDVKKPPKIITK